MKKLFRTLRGLTGVGLTWGAFWGVVGAGIGAAIGFLSPDAWIWGNPIAEWAMGIGAYGFVSGVGFGGLISLGEGARTLRELSLKRVALWGALGSVAVPLVFGALGMFGAGTTLLDIMGAMLVTGGLGALSAPASVAAAQRAELGPGEEAGLLSGES